MKKEVMAAIAAALAIWFFVMGFEIGIYKERRDNARAAATTNPPVVGSSDVAQTLPTVTPSLPTVPQNDVTAPTAPSTPSVNTPSTPAPAGEDVSNLSVDEIVSRASAAINGLKQTPNFTALRTLKVNVTVVDCSVPSVTGQINDIINGILGKVEPQETLTFVGGVATNSKGEQLTSANAVPPENRSFTLTSAGVSSAKAEKQGENTVYTISIVSESTTGENPVPPHNSASLGFLDITSLGLPSIVKITKANMNYPGSTLQATVNKDGKLIHLKNYLPMTGDGEAKVVGIGGSAQFEGALDEEWSITY